MFALTHNHALLFFCSSRCRCLGLIGKHAARCSISIWSEWKTAEKYVCNRRTRNKTALRSFAYIMQIGRRFFLSTFLLVSCALRTKCTTVSEKHIGDGNGDQDQRKLKTTQQNNKQIKRSSEHKQCNGLPPPHRSKHTSAYRARNAWTEEGTNDSAIFICTQRIS